MVDKEYAKIFNDLSQDNPVLIMGMATLRKSLTGLPVNIWVDDYMVYKRSGHGQRIKFQPDKGDHPVSHGFASMTVSDNPEVIGEHELSSKEVQAVKDFVLRNKDSLVALGDMKIGIEDFLQAMKKG